MKFLGILFACGVAFMTLVVLDTIEAQVKQFTSFDDFFVHLQQTANSWIDFVRQIQALMCPDQPVCADNGILDRDDVLKTLPATLIVANVTVKLNDARGYAGVCCLPCSCSDICWQHDNCCPTKQVLTNESATTEVKTECIIASIKSYVNKAFPPFDYMDFMHPMTTDCFTADPNQSLLASCRTPDTTQFVDTIPVTSQTTGNTYWNRACAACNEDDNDIIDWTPNVIFKRAIPYFTVPPSVGAEFPDTFDKLLPFVNSRRGQGDIIYKPPTSMEDNVCLRKDSIYIDYCKPSPARNNQALEGWTSDACDKFYNPVYGTAQPFMNIFCFICQYKIEPKDKDIACRKSFSKAGSGILQAVLDYRRNEGNKEKYGIAASTVKDKRCTCTEIYDPYLHQCRTTYCPAGEIYGGCKCIKLLQDLSGMGVLLKIKVISRSDTTQHLTDTQVRMLQTSIKRKILSIVDYITVSIGATFQQENNYLVIVVIKSDPGHDTKLTVEPLIKYLDTDKRLEVNVGKRALSATLTSKIALSKQNEATNALIYTARDMEQPMSRFELLYADDAIMKALGGYQPLSKLLYCKQLQLNDTEYFRRSGPVVTNTSAPLFPIFDYYMITPTQIRVCVDSYLQSGKGNNKRSGGHKAQGIPYSLMMQSLLLTMVIWTTIT